MRTLHKISPLISNIRFIGHLIMKRCIAICILALFLLSGCVTQELLSEHDLEVEEAFDRGYRDGYDDGYDDGLESGIEKGSEQSYAEFYDEGYRDGYRDGLASAVPSESVTRSSVSGSSSALIRGLPGDTIVYVSDRSHTIHRKANCSGMKNYFELTLADADSRGYSYCSKCWD